MQTMIDELFERRGDYSGDRSQVEGAFYPKATRLDPYHELMMAVLEDAIHMVDLRWINSRWGDYVFSFTRICEELDLNPGAVRDALNLRLQGKEPRKKTKYLKKSRVAVNDHAGDLHPYDGPRHCTACNIKHRKAQRERFRIAQAAA